MQKLEQSENDAPDKEKKKIRLLNQLGEEIFAERVNEETSELESELIKGLPDLLGDPNLKKKYFLKEGSVISDLVEHTFERSKDHIDKDSDEVERRRFTNEDLPSGGSDYSEASKEAREAIEIIQLNEKETIPIALDIINRNLDKAIQRTIKFSGDSVIALFTQLRQYLKSGKELILLVEEYARLRLRSPF